MPRSPLIRLVLADNDAMMRSLIRMFIQADPHIIIIGEATNGDRLLTLCETLHPMIVLMDSDMSELSAVEVVECIHDYYPETKVIMVTTEAVEAYIRQMAQVRVAGYVLKHDVPDCLLEAIHSVNAGTAWYSPKIRAFFTTC
jgi:DNA-binding NarL/FixJ family response regulator